MNVVVVQRSFVQPVAFAALQEQELRAARCLDNYRVRFLQTALARDGRRMVCLYTAPDAEAVRSSQREAGLPFDHVWSGTRQVLAAGSESAEVVVVERTFAEPMTLEIAGQRLEQASSCLALHRVAYRETVLARDGRRMFCLFAAADAESVRAAQRQADLPFEAVWPATLHLPG